MDKHRKNNRKASNTLNRRIMKIDLGVLSKNKIILLMK